MNERSTDGRRTSCGNLAQSLKETATKKTHPPCVLAPPLQEHLPHSPLPPTRRRGAWPGMQVGWELEAWRGSARALLPFVLYQENDSTQNLFTN